MVDVVIFLPTRKQQAVKVVPLAAASLGISEFDLFQVAYRGWFKQRCDRREIDRALEAFHSQGAVPYWLEHYLRQLDARIRFLSCRPRQSACAWLPFLLFVSPALHAVLWCVCSRENHGSDMLVC